METRCFAPLEEHDRECYCDGDKRCCLLDVLDHAAARHPSTRRSQPFRKPSAATEITVDHFNVLPTERTNSLRQFVLKPLTFEILSNLLFTRLAQVDDCFSGQVLWLDFRTV